MNAISFEMFAELEKVFETLLADTSKEVRVIVLSAVGPHFTAGLDLKSAMQIGAINQ